MKQKKRERRLLRKNRNKLKEQLHKEQAWERGKLIEENHNNQEYSEQYTVELKDRLINILKTSVDNSEDENSFRLKFLQFKNKIRDLILLWNINVPKDLDYQFLKYSLETYWDSPNNLLKNIYNKIYDQ